MNVTAAQQKTAERLNRIELLLAEMTAYVEQEKADIGNAGWATAGELGYIAEQLENVAAFWRGGDE